MYFKLLADYSGLIHNRGATNISKRKRPAMARGTIRPKFGSTRRRGENSVGDVKPDWPQNELFASTTKYEVIATIQ
jgi:hypothetical protein